MDAAGAALMAGTRMRCSVHPLGGTAYLSLESTEEPFAGGIKFTAMPPTKRFRDMEQLSGGEKVRCSRRGCLAPHPVASDKRLC